MRLSEGIELLINTGTNLSTILAEFSFKSSERTKIMEIIDLLNEEACMWKEIKDEAHSE